MSVVYDRVNLSINGLSPEEELDYARGTSPKRFR
jgi:hypothetical protein